MLTKSSLKGCIDTKGKHWKEGESGVCADGCNDCVCMGKGNFRKTKKSCSLDPIFPIEGSRCQAQPKLKPS